MTLAGCFHDPWCKHSLTAHLARPGLEDMPWGSREMSVKDPFGNRLTFTMDLD